MGGYSISRMHILKYIPPEAVQTNLINLQNEVW